MDLRQSSQYAKYIKLTGWVVEKVNGYYVYIRKIPLTPFSIIKVQRPKEIPFKKIDRLAQKHRALVVYLEPLTTSRKSQITEFGYRLHKSPFLPAKTIHLDLTQSEEKILAQMKKDARYEIRKAKKEAIQLIKVQDLERFHQAWRESVGWRRYVPSLKNLKALKKSFGKNAIFLTVESQTQNTSEVKLSLTSEDTSEVKGKRQKIIAGTVILIAGKTAYYYYAFSSKEGRRKSAQYLLVWEAIKLAKKRGCQIFDFEGIYDERFPIKSWKGFSHFKKSFGGKEIEYPGCFVRYCLPF